MKKYEVLAIILIILHVIVHVSSPLCLILLNKFYSAGDMANSNIYRYLYPFILTSPRILIGIAIAVWLGYQAKKDGCSAPVWALFGLVFSILGAILYFVLRNQASHTGQPDALQSS